MHWADAPSGLPRLLLSPQGAGARDAKGGKRPSPAPTRRRAPQRGSRTLPRRVGSSPPLPCPSPCRPGDDPRESAPASSSSHLPYGQAPPHLSPSPPLPHGRHVTPAAPSSTEAHGAACHRQATGRPLPAAPWER